SGAGRAGRAGGVGGQVRDRFPGAGGGTPGGQERRLGGAGGFGGLGGNAGASVALVKLLETEAPGYKWAAATVGSDSAASMELSTGGVPVMAIGGFSGSDPAPTLATFQQMVAAHEVHYFVAGGGAAGGFAGFPVAEPSDSAIGDQFGGGPARGGAGSDAAQITAWVEAHFQAQTVGGAAVYDLTAPGAASSAQS
ncbi:MAG: hypothetical protein ACRDP7_38825, partial [Trebonia sp.]